MLAFQQELFLKKVLNSGDERVSTQFIVETMVSIYQKCFGTLLEIPNIIPKHSIENITKEAHIFGSGASVLNTMTLLNANSVTFGCNITLALLPKWNYGFVERLEKNPFGEMQMQVLMDREFEYLILKNTYPLKFNKTIKHLDKVKKNHNVCLLRECQILSNRNDVKHILAMVMDDTSMVMRQYASSVLTMILFAVRLGLKKIIIHGVDFGGACFYNQEPYMDYNFESASRQEANIKHQTDSYDIPFAVILERVIQLLHERGIQVQHAKELL